jgi:hypothetical protein
VDRISLTKSMRALTVCALPASEAYSKGMIRSGHSQVADMREL